jgi:hypothetical protein
MGAAIVTQPEKASTADDVELKCAICLGSAVELLPRGALRRGAPRGPGGIPALTPHRKAAEQGYAKAQHNPGSMYEHGEGIGKDMQKAVPW